MTKDYIEQRDGRYYIVGTRVSLDSIVHAFHRGESPETIRQNFDVLQLGEVYGAIAYYLANHTDIDAYLLRQEELSEENRRRLESVSGDVRARLMRVRDELHSTRAS